MVFRRVLFQWLGKLCGWRPGHRNAITKPPKANGIYFWTPERDSKRAECELIYMALICYECCYSVYWQRMNLIFHIYIVLISGYFFILKNCVNFFNYNLKFISNNYIIFSIWVCNSYCVIFARRESEKCWILVLFKKIKQNQEANRPDSL